MNATKCLIVTYGFFGDIIFASSIADKFKEEPMLGPKNYFPDAGHITLDPYLTDNEVFESIVEALS